MGRNAKAIAAISALLLLTCAVGATSATAAPPVVSMGSVSSVTYTSAHLTGTIDPQDNETFYSFEYATDPKAANWSGFAFEGSVAGGSGPTTVEANLSGLKPGTEYFVRLAGWNFLESQVNSKPVIAFETDPVAPPAVSISAPSQVTDSSAHFEGEIDPGGTDAAFDVNWHFQCTPACPGLEGTTPADGSSHTVEADATALKPGTAYSVSLIAQNAGAEASAGPESLTTDTRAPQVLSTSATALNTEAALRGQVDPGGLATSYRFEYGPTAAYGQSTPTKTIPAGGDPVAVKADVAGLAPGSGYHFRLVVSNADGSDESADRAFATYAKQAPEGSCPNEAVRIQQGSTYLPDCRAYEQVSPVDKNGADVKNFEQLSTDGQAVAWESASAYADPLGSNVANTDPYVGRRSASGTWTTTAMFPRVGSAYRPDLNAPLRSIDYSDDLSSYATDTQGRFDAHDEDRMFPGALFEAIDVYFVGADHGPVWASHDVQPPFGNAYIDAKLQGASGDGRAIFFSTAEALSSEALPESPGSLYEWRAGQVRLVGRDEDGQPLVSSVLGSPVAGAQEKTVGNLPGSEAVAQDGRAFVYTGTPQGLDPQVYLHRADGSVLRISSSQRSGSVGQPATGGLTQFAGATPDLSRIVFSSGDRLTDDALPGGGDYVYDAASGSLTFLDTGGASGGSFTQKQGLIRISSNGQYIYYLVLVGEDVYDLYVRTPTAVRRVASSLAGEGEGEKLSGEVRTPSRTWTGVTPNGHYFVFATTTQLTSQPTNGNAAIYLYNVDADALTCVSCPSDGGAVTSPSWLLPEKFRAFAETPRSVSDDGSTVVFSTTQSLVPRDTNNAVDVYVYRNGAAHLISSGVNQEQGIVTGLAGMSPTGSDIYFVTRARLAPTDIDGLADMYDARIDGGSYLSAGAPCQGEACRPGPGAVGSPQAIATGSVFGAAKAHRKKHKAAKHRKKARRGRTGPARAGGDGNGRDRRHG